MHFNKISTQPALIKSKLVFLYKLVPEPVKSVKKY